MPVMQVKYIFLRKTSKDIKDGNQGFNATPFKDMFKGIFNNITEKSFDISINNTLYTVDYKNSSKKNGSICYLSLVVEGTLFQCAKILNEANTKLTKGIHRKDYNIILSFDGVSHYFCNRVYPKFNLFERKIRELIFSILVKSLGINWYDATIQDTLKTEIEKQTKGMNRSDLIERALYEMTIYQLETYLFTPYRELDISTMIDNELSQTKINEKTKEEIVDIINKCRAKCLWDRFFENSIQINNLQSNLETIRYYRNSVAHSKHFYKEDYDKCNRMLNKLLRQMDKAIDEIEIRTFSRGDIRESLSVLAETFGLFYKGIASLMSPTIKEISQQLAKATQINIPKVQFDVPKIDPQFAVQLNAITAGLKINPQIEAELKAQMKAFKGISSTLNGINKFNTPLMPQLKVLKATPEEIEQAKAEINEKIKKTTKGYIPEKQELQITETDVATVHDTEVSED